MDRAVHLIKRSKDRQANLIDCTATKKNSLYKNFFIGNDNKKLTSTQKQ